MLRPGVDDAAGAFLAEAEAAHKQPTLATSVPTGGHTATAPNHGGSGKVPLTRTRIACADSDGAVHIFVGARAAAPRDCSPATLFGGGTKYRLPTPAGGAEGVSDGPVAQLAVAGRWLYAATEAGAVVAWPIDCLH